MRSRSAGNPRSSSSDLTTSGTSTAYSSSDMSCDTVVYRGQSDGSAKHSSAQQRCSKICVLTVSRRVDQRLADKLSILLYTCGHVCLCCGLAVVGCLPQHC